MPQINLKSDFSLSETFTFHRENILNNLEKNFKKSAVKTQILFILVLLAVLDQKFEEKLGSVAGKVSGKDHSESVAGTDDLEADKLKEQNLEGGQEVEQLDQNSQKDAFARTIDEMRKVCLFIPKSMYVMYT